MPEFVLSSRAVIGMFYDRLTAATGMEWINAISMEFQSDQESETYAWLGMVPQMREWAGGRQPKSLREYPWEIKNVHYESTIEVPVRWMRRDKTGQIQVRINDMADRANSHWASLLSTLLLNGGSTVCYDGQYFFDTDHAEESSGAQSNSISVDISALPTGAVDNHGSVTAPHPLEFQMAVIQAIQQLLGFKDGQGEPMNEGASNFLVIVPTSLWIVANTALMAPVLASGQTNIVQSMGGINLTIAANPRLTWTDKFVVIRTDGAVKPFIRQNETGIQVKAKAEGSEFEFDNDAHQYGIDTWRNVGYGFWQHAVLVTMT